MTKIFCVLAANAISFSRNYFNVRNKFVMTSTQTINETKKYLEDDPSRSGSILTIFMFRNCYLVQKIELTLAACQSGLSVCRGRNSLIFHFSLESLE